MKLEWLRSFVAFAERRNFTHAAEALHVSQPALHVQVQKLAEALGVPLYRKVGRELVLTVEGEKLAAFAREIEERSAEFLDELATGSSHQRVVLCAGEGAFLYLLGPTIRSFTKKETTALELMTADAIGTIDAVRSGTAHIGVLSLETTPPDLTAELMTEVPHMIVFPKNHRLAKKRRLGLADLDEEALIVPPQGRPLRTTIEQRLTEAGSRLRVAVEASGWEVMLHFVSLGVGAAIVNGCCKLPRGLRGIPLKELPNVRYQILSRRGPPLRRGARALRTMLMDQRVLKSWE